MSQSRNELTFINGKIFTSNPKQPYASAMVVRNGRIAWIGEEEDLKKIEGTCVDLNGKRVLPGLIELKDHNDGSHGLFRLKLKQKSRQNRPPGSI